MIDTPTMLQFLRDLSANNSLEWMHAHQAQYKAAKGIFEDLLQALIDRIASFDPSVAGIDPRQLIFRLQRDTRFSHDKSPYRAAFRAHISPGLRTPFPPAYYLSLSPGKSFLGGGIFAAMFSEATAMVRDAIVRDPDGFQAILNHPDFTANFTLEGEKLKRVPAGYPTDLPVSEYLKHKSWDIEYPISDDLIEDSEQFLRTSVDLFQKMKPLNDFLTAATAEFMMPVRK